MTVTIAQQKVEQMMALAMDASPNGMVMIDKEGIITLVNRTIETMFGYQKKELEGSSIEILVPERYRNSHPAYRNEYLTQPKSRPMGKGMELFGRKKNGEEFPVEIGLNPVHYGDDVFILAAIVDITERKHAEETMYLAVEAAPNGMILTNAEGHVVYMNSMAEKIFGYTRSELTGKSISVLVPKRFREVHPRLQKHFYDYPQARAMGHGRDLFGCHKNGNEIPLEIGLNPIKTNQGLMILASVVDITERKQQESTILNALKEKDMLLSEIHHRVKNNLQIIDSLIGIQSEQIKDATTLNCLLECQNRVKSMAIIHRTLYESKDFSKVDCQSVIETLVDNLVESYAVNSDRIKTRLQVEDIKLPINVSIPLGLIINELCSNVFKHAYPRDQSGIMQVSLEFIDNGAIQLEVTDCGQGLDDDLDLNESKTLGLMLVQLLSEQIQGQLTINRRNPTRFTIVFQA